MFNTWLSRRQKLSPIGKVFFVLENTDKNIKKTSLQVNSSDASFSYSELLLKKTELNGNFPFFNRSFDKKKLKSLFSWYYANRGEALTFSLVEKVQKLGFSYAMKAGISLGIDDLKVPPTKNESLTEAVENLANTKALVNSGNVTANEEFQQFVDTWHRTSENLKTSVVQNFSQNSLSFVKKSKVEKRSDREKTIIKGLSKSKGFIKQKGVFTGASSRNILNPVYMMAFSGARGNISQVRQLVGMRGLMADPQGQLVEFPIQSNFREGLTVTEYMISCYGARKGLVDTALRTAAAGYLTRRLVDVSHHQIVRFVTCSTKNGILLVADKKKEQMRGNLLPSAWKVSPISKKKDLSGIGFQELGRYQKTQLEEPTTSLLTKGPNSSSSPVSSPISSKFVKEALPLLTDKPKLQRDQKVLFNSIRTFNKTTPKESSESLVFCVGRVLARDIPGLAFRNQEIDISLASRPLLKKTYEENGIYIRSPLTCASETGICQLCYGWSVSHNRLVGLGEAVGIIAAQSIGEPGTQLTMRTFHTGGVFSGDIMEECRALHQGIVHFQTIYLGLLVRTAGGLIAFCLKTPGTFQIKGSKETTTYNVSANTLLFVRQGEKVLKDSLLAQIPNLPTIEENSGEATKTIVSELSGEVRQKETVNPQLASFRILAGQEYTQFYIFNSDFGRTSIQRRKQFSLDYLSKGEVFQIHSNKGRVNMISGAHRLGNNNTFWLNIKGSKSQVILPLGFAPLHKSFQQSLAIDKKSHKTISWPFWPKNTFTRNLDSNVNTRSVLETSFRNNSEGSRTQNILNDLRFFVCYNIHKNPVNATASLKKSNIYKVSNQRLNSLYFNVKGAENNKNSFFKQGLFPFLLQKKKTFPNFKDNFGGVNFLEFFSLEKFETLHLNLLTSFFSEVLKDIDLPKNVKNEQNFNLSLDHSKSLPFIGINKFQGTVKFLKNSVQLKNKQNNDSIKKIADLSFWPNNYQPNMFYYGYFFWTLKDLIFLKEVTKNKKYSLLRVVKNKQWWGYSKEFNTSLRKELFPLNGLGQGNQLIEGQYQSKKTTVISVFPSLVLNLKSRFNCNEQLNTVFLSKQLPSLKNIETSKKLKPKIQLQDSGEIFPFQGNKNIREFQLRYHSFQKVSSLNSGLLMHYNRVSYKLPLSFINSSVSIDPLNLSLSDKERVIFIRSMLAQLSIKDQTEKNFKRFWTNKPLNLKIRNTQIGDFINTGDEIIKDTASAHCGQIIEKSPITLTLRLTQNLLYPNLQNRPAKINKNVKNGHWISKGAPLVTLPYISNVTGDIVAGIPKIEQLFEARGETLDEAINKIWDVYKVSIVPRSKAVRECFKEIGLFVVAAIQKVYSSQGVHIADKHLEVIIRQMTRRALIVDPGDTEFLPEEFVDLDTIECVNWTTYGESATYRPRLIGITKASLTSNSFLSSASFQQTARVLERETILEKTDRLLGLKERVMMGALINAGTGELKTTVQLSDRSRTKSLSYKLLKRLNFFSRRKVHLQMANT